jgi:hypothetical protein
MSLEENDKTNDQKSWFQQNKLALVGGLWASAMTTTFVFQHAFQNSSNTRTSVKVIHSRLYSQAITLTALIAASGVEYYDRTYGEKAKRGGKDDDVSDPFEYKHRRVLAKARKREEAAAVGK